MILITVITAAALMVLWECVAGGRRWPAVRGWWARALFLNVVQLGVAWIAALSWEGWLLGFRPWSIESLGTTAGALIGYLAITFLYYWWHRLRHEVAFLWRWVHQVHHSPQRIEIITSFYKHPLEIVINSWFSAGILYLLVGVGPEACALAILITGLAELFYHWNVRTPHWLGYVIQRPESHCVHHERDLHAFNYGDLPLWDILFGTFRNPRDWRSACGFSGDREQRLAAMLMGKIVE